MYIHEEQFKRRNNNFDALRVLAALLVFASHATGFRRPLQEEPLAAFTNDEFHMSRIGLFIFFTLSGFLVCRSLQRSSASGYWRNRLLRIVPGIAVWAILVVTLVGPIFTTLPVREYWTDSQTLFFVLQNSLPFQIAFTLPGVFGAKALNPSLWTIPLELKCYLLLFLAQLVRFLTHKKLLMAGWLILLTCNAVLPTVDHDWVRQLRPHKEAIQLGAFFFGGVVYYLYRHKLPLKLSIWVGLLVIWLSVWKISIAWLPVTSILFFIYSIIGIGASKIVIPFFTADLSYGIYLYGATIQKVIFFSIGSQLAFWQFNALTLTLTIGMALASWHLVEKKALGLKRHWPVAPVHQTVAQPEGNTDHDKQ